MNHLDLLSATSGHKLRVAQSVQQLSAHDALLSAALVDFNHGGMLRSFQRNQNTLLQYSPLDLSRDSSSSHDYVRDILSNFGFGSNANQILAGALGSGSPPAALGMSSNPRLLEAAVAQRRLDFERLQSIRKQVLAITEENPFQLGHPRGDLRNLIPNSEEHQVNHPPFESPSPKKLNAEGTLAALGAAMRKKSSPYIDASHLSDPDPSDLARRRTRGGVTEPFPEKLHRMLLEVEESGDSNIISFFSHGRAFGVHDPERFVHKIMPKYFKQSRMSSFQRQLNLYGFTRISSGADAGGYYHELFLKGRPALCVHMRRVGVPQGEDRRKLKSGARKSEPDFYSMQPLGPFRLTRYSEKSGEE